MVSASIGTSSDRDTSLPSCTGHRPGSHGAGPHQGLFRAALLPRSRLGGAGTAWKTGRMSDSSSAAPVVQGKGWPYIEAVLARTAELARSGEPLLIEVAAELGLDAEEFDTALIDGRHLLIVDADQAEGKAIGVTGTPTYVIGDERLDGGKSQDGLRERIEEIADRLLAER